MSASTAPCLPQDKAKEAVTHVIETVLGFTPHATCPLWLALVNDATDESQVNIYSQWLWLTKDKIAALKCRPDPTKQQVIPLSRGHLTHVTRFKAMHYDLRTDPAWTDLDILKITCDEYMAFSRRYFSGQVTENPSPSPSSAERLMIERATDSTPLSSEPEKLLAIPTYAPPGKEAVHAALRASDNVDGNAKDNVELAASHQSFESAGEATLSTLCDMDPQLSLFHGGHQVVPAVKLKMIAYDVIGGTPLQTSNLSGSVVTMTTQCFDNHGLECDFYSLMPLHGKSLKEISCDTRLCDPSCHSALQMPAQDHGEDFTSDARSCFTPTSKVWLLNENTKSIFGWCERRLSVATFLEVTSGDSSLPTSSTAPHVKTMSLLYADPRVLTRATSVDVSTISSRQLSSLPPFRQAHGTDNDTSPMLCFSFYEPACYLVDEITFPSESKELCGRWVGISENVEHFMTYKIFADDARRATHRSNIRSATDPHARNLRLYLLNDEVIRSPRKSSPTSGHGEDFSLHSAEPADESSSECLTNGDNAGRTFLMDAQENGQGSRARVVERISEREPNAQRIPERESNAHRSGDHVKFRVPVSKDKHEETTKSSELKESSGSADHPITAVPDRVGLFGDATVEDDDEYISRLFPDLAEFVLDLQSNLERSIAEMLANDKFIALPDSASPFRSSLVRSNNLSELAPSSDLPSLSSARMLPSATARNQLSGSSKAFDVDNDCAVIAAPDTDSFNNKFSYESATNLRSLMGSIVIRKHFHSSCLQLKASV